MYRDVYQVNAFTANGEHGNPAGVMFDADGLDDTQKQTVAREIGFPETVFVESSDEATRRLRFFSPAREIDLCGHATIAAWSLLYQRGEISAGNFTQATDAGKLGIEIAEDGTVFMEQQPAQFYDKIFPTEIAPLLGVEETDFHKELQPQIVSTGVRDLFVPLAQKAMLAHLQPDMKTIEAFSERHNISALHVFSVDTDNQSVTAARNFAPIDGIPEESATGTSSGALLCYLRENYQLPDRDIYRLEQGEAMGELSYIFGMFRDGVVWVGGQAVVRHTLEISI